MLQSVAKLLLEQPFPVDGGLVLVMRTSKLCATGSRKVPSGVNIGRLLYPKNTKPLP